MKLTSTKHQQLICCPYIIAK